MDRDTIMTGPAASPDDRSEYYRAGFYSMVRIVNLQALAIVVLTALFLFYVYTGKKADRYFAETAEGRKMQMIGLSYPNMGRAALSGWIASAASEVMTFGFNDLEIRFDKSKKNFTAEGWKNFREAMIRSKLIEEMTKLQQIVTSVPQSVPILVKEGLINGHYSWVYEMKLLSTFRAGAAKTTRVKSVRIVLQQVPTADNPNAVGISEWYIY